MFRAFCLRNNEKGGSVLKNAKLTDTRYLYLSSLVCVMESTLAGKEQYEKMLEAESSAECLRLAIELYSGRGEVPTDEEALLRFMAEKTYREIDEALLSCGGENKLLAPLRLPYDGQNLKACIKCEKRSLSPVTLLMSCGTVPKDEVQSAVAKRDFSLFTPHIRESAPETIEEFSKTSDPSTVDRILDRAVFLDRKEMCDKIGLSYLSRLCALKADLTNVISFARAARIGAERSFFESFFLPGGEVSYAFFAEHYEKGLEELLSALSVRPAFSALEKALDAPLSLGELERLCDEIFLACALTARGVSFGAEKPLMFAIERENEIRNIRILLAGKKAGLSKEDLRARLRGVN